MEPFYEGQEDEHTLDLPSEHMMLNMGPSHPAMHGTVRMVLELDGETIVDVDVQPGYLHRGFEKSCERGTWSQVFPYADRLNYASPMLNNVGFSLAVEKLIDLKVPERCTYYRTVLGEVARIADHLTCNAANAMELGAFTPFLWLVKVRDWIYDILEQETGARVTHSFGRIGGMAKPPTPQLKDTVLAIFPEIDHVLLETEALLMKNRIFVDRMQGIGILSKADALAAGITGPVLRSTGVDYDVRKANPYMFYDRFDFDVPVGHDGDNFDRFACRFEEVRQSMRIIRQALDQMPTDGPVNSPDVRYVFPEKRDVYESIEGTIAHFKLVMEGLKPPVGEVYSFTEAGNGELGFYIVSDGSGTPYRVRCRPPCWYGLGAARAMLLGNMLPDIIPTFGSINMIGGECDR